VEGGIGEAQLFWKERLSARNNQWEYRATGGRNRPLAGSKRAAAGRGGRAVAGWWLRARRGEGKGLVRTLWGAVETGVAENEEVEYISR